MRMDELARSAFGRALEFFDPFMLFVDMDGHIDERVDCMHQLLPAESRTARVLMDMLPEPVCVEWLDLVRNAMARSTACVGLSVIGGHGFGMLIDPRAEPGIGAIIMLFRSPLHVVGHGRERGPGHLELVHHDWGHLASLSRTQLDTLRSLTMGLSNGQIAEQSCRTRRAIEWHIRHLNRVLHTESREQLAAIGRLAGLEFFSDVGWSRVLRSRPFRRCSERGDPLDEPAREK